MGLWSFVKETGSSWFGGQAKADTPPDGAVIKAEMEKIGLNMKGVELKVEGDKIVVEGTAVSPEEKEKIIVAAGNVRGVA